MSLTKTSSTSLALSYLLLHSSPLQTFAATPPRAERNKRAEARASALVGAKAMKEEGGGKAGKLSEIYVDELCEKFCDDYFELCTTNNIYINKNEDRRRLQNIPPDENLPRYDDLHQNTVAMEQCQKTCMEFPRGLDPARFHGGADYSETELAGVFNSNLGGDTIWCRRRHLSLAAGSKNHAAFHCPHASNPSMGICRDSLVNGYTPYELLRDGTPTRHHFGYCDLAKDGIIADCTALNILEEDLPHALAMMPSTVEIIFLNGNFIDSLKANIFHDNLKNPSNIQAIYMNDCFLKTIDEMAFMGLSNLKIFNADQNEIDNLPEKLLEPTPNLLQFSVFNNPNILEIPAKFFSYTTNIERIVMYGLPALDHFKEGTFDGLTKLLMMSFVNCDFSNDGFPDGIFKDLVSLQFFDFFGNNLDSIEARWFDGGWGSNILRLAFWGNPINKTEPEAFETLDSLEVLYLHGTDMAYFDPELVYNKKYFTHLTIGECFDPACGN